MEKDPNKIYIEAQNENRPFQTAKVGFACWGKITSICRLEYSIMFLAIVCVLVCSCKKSGDKTYSEVSEKAAAILRQAVTNGSGGTNTINAAEAEEYIKAIKSDVAEEIASETADAGTYLLQLREEDRLPGVSENEHGQISSDVVPFVVSNKFVEIAYPAERIFHVVKNGEVLTNNYILIKRSKDAGWKLQRAWETGSNGHTIREWSVQ